MNNERLNGILSSIDQVNNQDPNQITFDNVTYPKEYIYGHQMTNMLDEH